METVTVPPKFQVVIPLCVIRSMAASESGASRPPNPEHVDH